ncbi:hypothetical protein RRG08_021514 [Elysia crispata]|uniref:SCP domain-containing protein n=1 Tax=Elysia crispata TaxID=231223 RepID=A0AAE1BDF6_9GAST|nr:hypothetical protein RRG08_021514 [Elysia crispata]
MKQSRDLHVARPVQVWHTERGLIKEEPFLMNFACSPNGKNLILTYVASDPVEHDVMQLLSLTNRYRSRTASTGSRKVSNMNRLEWSEALAAQAEASISCRSHRRGQVQMLERFVTHVNVGRRRDRSGALTNIMNAWYHQEREYDPVEEACYPWDICKQYRNMINAKHRLMGCAYIQDCGIRNDSVVLMCIFEGGNQYMFDFQHGNVCTGCSGSTSFCNDSLCVFCNASRHECECTKTCRKATIGLGQLDASTCTCTCQYGLGPNCDQLCRNPHSFFDVDVCSGVTQQDCQDPGVNEFCPEQCTCSFGALECLTSSLPAFFATISSLGIANSNLGRALRQIHAQ